MKFTTHHHTRSKHSRPNKRRLAIRLGLLATVAATALAVPSAIPSASAAQTTTQARVPQNVAQQLAWYPGGKQINANEVSYKNGTVIVSFPSSAATASSPGVTDLFGNIHGCPAGKPDNRWYCFYQDKDFKGRMVKWNLPHCHKNWLAFNDVGFNNETSSWVNTGGLNIAVFNGVPYKSARLWHENPHTEVSWVGDANNDKASAFITSCG